MTQSATTHEQRDALLRQEEHNAAMDRHQPLRLLILNYEYPPLGGGAGTVTANVARELAAMGHTVRVVTSSHGDLPRREMTHGFEIRRIAALRWHLDHCTPFEMLSFMASAAVALPLMARSFRPDACVAYFGIPCGPSAMVLRWISGVPYVISLAGGDVPGFLPEELAVYHKLTGWLIRLVWRQAAHVVANSRGLAELALRSAGTVPIPIIANGVDTACFHPRETSDHDGPVRLLTVGRLVRQKGLDVLLEALALLPPTTAWQLTIAGEGPLRAELAAQAQRLGFGDRVRFTGWMHREQELPQLMRHSDVFVMPSRNEGMSNALLEAMASGLPVAATRICGSDELVTDDETGFLVEPEDPVGLAAILARLTADLPLCRRLGAASRERVVREYSWRAVAERYAALCRPAEGSRPAQGA